MLNSAEHEIFSAKNLKLLRTANSFLLNIAEHEHFSANKYEIPTIVGILIFLAEKISCSADLSMKTFYNTRASTRGV